MNVVLYSTGCPQCNVLTKKLDDKNVQYTKNENVDDMLALGIDAVPVLSVDGKLLPFGEAVQWVNAQEA